MLIFLFWLCACLVVYIYFGYPLLVAWLGSESTVNGSASELPTVSILIPAFNEEAAITDTLRNKISLDYPPEKLEIIVVSDSSDDRTDELVEAFARDSSIPVRLIRQHPRAGKTSGINLIVPEAKGEIIAFSDSNSLWDRDALRHLVSVFTDTSVGYVTGKMVYTNPDGSLVGDGCSAYMKYENWLREKETNIGSIVGVDGGIDAMRRCLYQPLRPDQLPDFVQPLKVVEAGYRVVYEERAILKEDALSDENSEYRMRVRVSLRAMWALKDMSALLNPFRYGLFALQLFSHKVLRYLAFIPLLLLMPLNVMLLGDGPVYTLALLAQAAFYLLAWLGYSGKLDTAGVLKAPYYFVLINIAAGQAFLKFCRGEKQVIWTPRVG